MVFLFLFNRLTTNWEQLFFFLFVKFNSIFFSVVGFYLLFIDDIEPPLFVHWGIHITYNICDTILSPCHRRPESILILFIQYDNLYELVFVQSPVSITITTRNKYARRHTEYYASSLLYVCSLFREANEQKKKNIVWQTGKGRIKKIFVVKHTRPRVVEMIEKNKNRVSGKDKPII